MTITREQMDELLRALRGSDRMLGVNEASRIISAAGIGDTWLYQCLMYEHPDAAWIAWRQEQAPDETQEEAVRQLRALGIFPAA